ncbi:MAG: AAA family ATPase [Pseudomonadota bacterium]
MKRRRRRSHALPDWAILDGTGKTALDKNDRFVLGRCATYLRRILARRLRFDEETLEFLAWILGPDTWQVADYLCDQSSGPQKGELLAALDKCRTAPDELPEVLLGHLRHSLGLEKRLVGFVSQLLESLEAKMATGGRSRIERNMELVRSLFHLREPEAELWLVSFLAYGWPAFEVFFEGHLACFYLRGRSILATLLNVTAEELRAALRGTLARLGILRLWSSGQIDFDDEYLAFVEDPARTLPGGFFSKLCVTTPSASDFVDRAKKEHVLALLRAKQKTPSHLLLYGPPGTGKTSFARSLANELGLPAYEVARGDENTAEQRRTALRACLNMTNAGEGSIIVMDEADNVLNTRGSWLLRGETQDKGWLNELLEEPGARVIWIVNDIERIEQSVLRRFAFTLEFKPFGRRQRIKLWESVLRRNRALRMLNQTEIANLAGRYKLSAGSIDMAVRKAREVCAGSRAGFRQAVVLALDAHHALLNGTERRGSEDEVERSYSLEGLNTTGDLAAMMARLSAFDLCLREGTVKAVRNMVLLFYGPPGTGKSELARYIAGTLDRELICKRISDLFDPYVGMTERNIRNAFAEAEAEEAVLVIDEADSLLFSRDKAVRSWEVSFTNEFLTRMERFRGILICTTNRLGDVDSAAMRRFNHKVEFKYLDPEGNVVFYRRLLCPLTNEGLTDEFVEELRSVSGLAPGDFKVVRDRFSLEPEDAVSHAAMLEALRREAALKPNQACKMHPGF